MVLQKVFPLLLFTLEVVCILTTKGETQTVRSAAELIDVFSKATGTTVDTEIELRENLDFSEGKLILPLGASANGTCMPYRGIFHGNGHSIQRLIINMTGNETYNGAGLFCKLENAKIENLALDTTCLFIGDSAGALTAEATGSLSVTNVVNRADVIGNTRVGGMIGYFEDINNGNVRLRMERCANEGSVIGSNQHIGGLVGSISRNNDIDVIIYNSINHGSVNGTYNIGGFVGCVHGNNRISLSFIDNWNTGRVYGNHEIGGYLGWVETNTNTNITISECTNNGITTGNTVNIGGFIGGIMNNTNTSFTLKHWTNNKVVNGSSDVGGFIGVVTENTGSTIEIFNSTRNGKTYGLKSNIGGFIGVINRNNNTSVIIHYGINRGTANGTMWSIGGLVGYIYTNTKTNITVLDITNDGQVIGKNNIGEFAGDISNNVNVDITVSNMFSFGAVFGVSQVGGFIGFIYSNTNLATTIANSQNHGMIFGEESSGGFVGEIEGNISMTLSNITNKGRVTGNYTAAGFVGNMLCQTVSEVMSITVTSSANKADIFSNNGVACGLFCIRSTFINKISATVFNSINKGSLTSPSAYGISHFVTKASNVVSMGEVKSTPDHFTFWKQSTDVNLVYGMKYTCFRCSGNEILFDYYRTSGLYKVSGNGKRVDELLNDEARKQSYTMLWTKDLDLSLSGEFPLSGSIPKAPGISTFIIAFMLVLFLAF